MSFLPSHTWRLVLSKVFFPTSSSSSSLGCNYSRRVTYSTSAFSIPCSFHPIPPPPPFPSMLLEPFLRFTRTWICITSETLAVLSLLFLSVLWVYHATDLHSLSIGHLRTLPRLTVTVSVPLFPDTFFLDLDSMVMVTAASLTTHSLASVCLFPEEMWVLLLWGKKKNLRILWVCSTQVLLHKKPAYREPVFVDNPLIASSVRTWDCTAANAGVC